MLTFGRDNSKDVLNALIQKADAFRVDSLNTELANQCAIDAWSLCDWVFKEYGQIIGFNSLKDFQASVKAGCVSMELLQDVANATKHKEITHYEPKLKDAKEHQGVFDRNVFSAAVFDVSALVLVREDGSEMWFNDALIDAVKYWENFFVQQGLL